MQLLKYPQEMSRKKLIAWTQPRDNTHSIGDATIEISPEKSDCHTSLTQKPFVCKTSLMSWREKPNFESSLKCLTRGKTGKISYIRKLSQAAQERSQHHQEKSIVKILCEIFATIHLTEGDHRRQYTRCKDQDIKKIVSQRRNHEITRDATIEVQPTKKKIT